MDYVVKATDGVLIDGNFFDSSLDISALFAKYKSWSDPSSTTNEWKAVHDRIELFHASLLFKLFSFRAGSSYFRSHSHASMSTHFLPVSSTFQERARQQQEQMSSISQKVKEYNIASLVHLNTLVTLRAKQGFVVDDSFTSRVEMVTKGMMETKEYVSGVHMRALFKPHVEIEYIIRIANMRIEDKKDEPREQHVQSYVHVEIHVQASASFHEQLRMYKKV